MEVRLKYLFSYFCGYYTAFEDCIQGNNQKYNKKAAINYLLSVPKFIAVLLIKIL